MSKTVAEESDAGQLLLPRVLTSNLVSESLRLDDSDVVDDTLVGVEIAGEPINRCQLTNQSAYFP